MKALLLGSTLIAVLALQTGSSTPSSATSLVADKPVVEKSVALSRQQQNQRVADLATLGRAMFFDPTLSASGKQSCASCHSPEHAFGPPNNLAVQLGGPYLKLPGTRAVPSLRYLQNTPAFTEHYHDDDGDDSIDAGPTGGRTWDGRVDSAREQARIPLLSKHEMGNASTGEVVDKLRAATYAAQLKALFGQHIFDHPEQAFEAAMSALEVFQENPAEFYPYSSKYDAFLRQQVKLTSQEMRGLSLFNDPDKGNCASCHISAVAPNGAFPQFTDYGLIALGAPRNRQIPANANPQYFDLGLCGPERTDFMDRKEYCGLFKTPTLRNVALRQTFFHNGVFHSLEEVMRFYVERDTAPQKWYPHNRDRSLRKFDDLLPAYRGNVNMEAPFGGKRGDKPVLSASEIQDVIAFMKTLTDGYRPASRQ